MADKKSPWFIILDAPQDIDALYQKLDHPDLIVIKPEALQALRAENGSGPKGDLPAPSLVESVQVRGKIEEELAQLTVELFIDLRENGPVWAPIRLDGHRLARAREGSLELGLRRAETGQWQLKLDGWGGHRIQVELTAPVIVAPGRRSISLAIPEAASTGVDLSFSHGETEFAVGDNEAVKPLERGDGKTAHLTTQLEPRSELVVSWTSASEAGARSAPLLTAKGEIAVDIDEEQVRTRTSWAVRCVRGTARSLEMRLSDDDDVTEFQVDEQPSESQLERARGTGKATIRLVDPLRVGGVRRVVMKTRRAFHSTAARSVTFAGSSFAGAREQTGFIGITQSANLFIRPLASRGLRLVDTEKLPADLRARPSTSLAFEFLEQPFLLELAVEPSPPSFKADVKTFFRIDADRVQNETTIEFERVRGLISELEFSVAAGLRLVSVGPPEVVANWHLAGDNIPPGSREANNGPRALKVRLTTMSRDMNKVALTLTGLQRIAANGPVGLGLFTPVDAMPLSSAYALVAERGLVLEPDDHTGRIRRMTEVSTDRDGSRAKWPWTVLGEDRSRTPVLLRNDSPISVLPIRIVRHSRTIAQDTVLSVQASRRLVDVLCRTSLMVRHGSVSSLELRVPSVIADRWELLDKELVDREELGQEADGARRYVLRFTRPVVDRTTIRFRYRVPLAPALDAKSVREISVAEVILKDISPGQRKVELSLAPEIILKEADSAWTRVLEEGRVESSGEGGVIAFEERDSSGSNHPFAFKALALEPVPLPSFVVSRLLLKTVSTDDLLRTSALYWVESHGSDFPFSLPEGARWVGARVDGRLAEQVDYDPSRVSYRLRFPADLGSRPVLVELEYQLSQQTARSKWPAPSLLDGGVVLQALWEVRLPLTRALLGVPSGWTDENQWYWTGYMWKRRPWKNVPEINEWVVGSPSFTRPLDDIDGSNLEDSDRYLFSRTGPPVGLLVWMVSRSWLVAICSGVTLVIGFFVIFARPRFQPIWMVIAVIGLLAAVVVQPSVMFLVLESAVVGGVLTLLGLVIELLVVRSRARSPLAHAGTVPGSRLGADSSLKRPPEVGSDDSTAIRVRVPSTVDYISAPVSAPPEVDEPRGSSWRNN